MSKFKTIIVFSITLLILSGVTSTNISAEVDRQSKKDFNEKSSHAKELTDMIKENKTDKEKIPFKISSQITLQSGKVVEVPTEVATKLIEKETINGEQKIKYATLIKSNLELSDNLEASATNDSKKSINNLGEFLNDFTNILLGVKIVEASTTKGEHYSDSISQYYYIEWYNVGNQLTLDYHSSWWTRTDSLYYVDNAKQYFSTSGRNYDTGGYDGCIEERELGKPYFDVEYVKFLDSCPNMDNTSDNTGGYTQSDIYYMGNYPRLYKSDWITKISL